MHEAMAGYLQWCPDYSVGEPGLDAQHQTMMELMNEIILYSFHHLPNERLIKRSLEGFLQFMEEHFMEEEVIMLKYNDPGYQEHKIDHDQCINRIRNFNTADSGSISPEYINELKKWIVEHIKYNDREIVSAIAIRNEST